MDNAQELLWEMQVGKRGADLSCFSAVLKATANSGRAGGAWEARVLEVLREGVSTVEGRSRVGQRNFFEDRRANRVLSLLGPAMAVLAKSEQGDGAVLLWDALTALKEEGYLRSFSEEVRPRRSASAPILVSLTPILFARSPCPCGPSGRACPPTARCP